MYDIMAAADRPTLAVHTAITHYSKINSGNHVLKGSAQPTLRDTRVGGMETESSSKTCGTIADIPEQEGKIRFLPRKSGHLRRGVKLTMLDTGKQKTKTAQ